MLILIFGFGVERDLLFLSLSSIDKSEKYFEFYHKKNIKEINFTKKNITSNFISHITKKKVYGHMLIYKKLDFKFETGNLQNKNEEFTSKLYSS